MKKMIRMAAIAAAFAFGVGGTAQAQDMEHYGGLGVGGFMIKSKPAGGASNSGSALGGFGYIGTDINDYFGLELRLGGTNGVTLVNTSYKMKYFFSYLAKGQFPVSDSVHLYGLVGGTTGAVSATGNTNQTKTSLSFGGGAKLRVDENWSLGAEWMRYWHNVKPWANQTEVSVDGISATLDLRF
jgi:opacity protein-like surface antigen